MVLGVDVGGTFTDAALLDGERLVTAKAPTTPADQSEGVMAAVEAALADAGGGPEDVERFVHGMTVGTNALLEGRTARTALFATEGFTDLEALGRQARAELYRLCAGHPPPLAPAELRIPVRERTGPDGVLRDLDEDHLRGAVADLPRGRRGGGRLPPVRIPPPRSRAARGGDAGRGAPRPARVDLARNRRRLPRVRALRDNRGRRRPLPLLSRYLERLTERARAAGLPEPEVMLSSGGVASAATAARHGSWTVLSGPAGGAVASGRLAEGGDAVGLDMGGTSCDVSLALGGRVAVSAGREVGGRALALPMVDVHTIGAGGGSIAWRDAGGALRVGPRSAGADPGPACYGRGGELPTVTDANLLLGYLDASSSLAGGIELDVAAAERAVGSLAEELGLRLEETADGIARVASTEMAQAVRVATVERGVDPRELALVAFGGAGPLHAAQIADELGMTRVVVPISSGVLSAVGLVVSERRRDVVESVLLSGDGLTRAAIAEVVDRLGARGREDLRAPDAELRATYELRYAGQAFELPVEGELAPDPSDLRRAFDRVHEDRYGYADPEAALELVTVRVAAALPGGELASAAAEIRRRESERASILELPGSTLVVPPEWTADIRADAVIMERT